MSACVNDKDSPACWFDTLAVDMVLVVAEVADAGGAEVDELFVIDEELMLDAMRGRVADDAMVLVTLADAMVDGLSPMGGRSPEEAAGAISGGGEQGMEPSRSQHGRQSRLHSALHCLLDLLLEDCG